MPSPYSPYAVCREILTRGEKAGRDDISPLKLMKLANICHGYHLALIGKPIFNDAVEAWKYGPVIRSIYEVVSHYKKDRVLPDQFNHIKEPLDSDSLEIIAGVMEVYGKLTPDRLSAITHKKGSPWYHTQKKWFNDRVIPNSLIKKYYDDLPGKS